LRAIGMVEWMMGAIGRARSVRTALFRRASGTGHCAAVHATRGRPALAGHFIFAGRHGRMED
jgi:hypothetical protein